MNGEEPCGNSGENGSQRCVSGGREAEGEALPPYKEALSQESWTIKEWDIGKEWGSHSGSVSELWWGIW